MSNAKKMDVPDIGGLLGQIAEKRHDLPKAPIQSVQAVEVKPAERKNLKTSKVENSKPAKPPEEGSRGVGGRPSVKQDDIEYVKLSPRIPKELKQQVVDALNHERYRDDDGNIIKTMDEFVAFSLGRVLKNT